MWPTSQCYHMPWQLRRRKGLGLRYQTPFEHRNARVKLPTVTQAVSQHQWISSSGWWDQGHPFAPLAWTFGMGSRWSCKWCLAVMEDLMAFAGFFWINSMLEDKGTRSLAGGFQDVLVSPLLGEDVQFDQHFFRWVETTHQGTIVTFWGEAWSPGRWSAASCWGACRFWWDVWCINM